MGIQSLKPRSAFDQKGTNSNKSLSCIKALLWIIPLVLVLTGCKKDADKILEDYGITISPANNAVIWGNQVVSLEYDIYFVVRLKSITVSGGSYQKSLTNDSLIVRYDQGSYNFILPTEQIPGHSVAITYEFYNEDIDPITCTYVINHMPVIHFTYSKVGYDLMLDLSGSTDPENKTLSFTWQTKDTVAHESTFTTTQDALMANPILIQVADDLAHTTDIVSIVPGTGEVILLTQKLKCIDLAVNISGPSLNAPGRNLGPNVDEGFQLDVDENKILKKSFVIGFMFEVQGTIVAGEDIILEGQDIAKTSQYRNTEYIKQGRKRDPANRGNLLPGTVNAPYPNPFPPATEPEMVEDDYTYHPSRGKIKVNGTNGVEKVEVMNKQVLMDGGVIKMVWNDQPDILLPEGDDLKKGIEIKRFFRAWMMPDLSLCQKYFIYELNIDNTGKIIKNKVTPFNF
jgi:hypothetical protein